ncbi:uncharacterized protein LOC125275951 isoform X1 [Megalobrama amblycephala]|uniref:uncharacterized protein LOC125275951 isoform X1 n=1 Tax=Megalobrama amblycephala TaxID=75352 RepID=UPI002013F450|nr:uncharacterized protein LOC125275951 isoform X1 [Megalobrama amblycephala]
MIRWLDFLLVLFLVYQCGILPVGNDHITETGEKGGNVTLTCEFKDHNISFELHNQTGDIVCDNEECPSKFDKKGPCDIIIKHLIFSDAGIYTLTVYYDDGSKEVEPNSRVYHLHIHGNISAKIGKPLKMDVLLINAAKVEKNSNGEWTEVWKSQKGVSSDRLIDRDGNLIINNFTASDAGTYRVLDSEGEIWITVTVTESSPKSGPKGGQRNIKTDTEQQKPNLNNTDDHGTNGKNWPVIVSVSVGFVMLVVVAVALIIYVRRRHQPPRRQHEQQENNPQYVEVPMNDLEQEAPAEH